MSKKAFFLLMLVPFLAACAKKNVESGSEMIIKINPMFAKMSLSDCGSEVRRAWTRGDAVSVVSSSGVYSFSYKESVTESMAMFSGSDPGSAPYDIIFPDKYKSVEEVMARSYTHQKQVGNNNMDAIELNILATGVTNPDQVDMTSTKAKTSGILKVGVSVPSGYSTVSSLTLRTDKPVFYATNGTAEKTNSLEMELSGMDIDEAGGYMIVYFAMSMESVSLPKGFSIHYLIHGTAKDGSPLDTEQDQELVNSLDIKGGCLSTIETDVEDLTIVQYNVGAFSKTKVSSIKTVAQMMKELTADVISLNELDSCNARNYVYQLKSFSEYMGNWNYNFAAAIPYKEGSYGVGVSVDPRYKVLNAMSFKLPKENDNEIRALSVMEFEKFVFCSTHLGLTAAAQAAQITEINRIINEQFPEATKPIFLCGDMNALPTSAAIKQLQEKWTILSPLDVTFSTNNPIKCIDYVCRLNRSPKVFVKQAYVCRSFVSGDVLQSSDHFPVLVSCLLQ